MVVAVLREGETYELLERERGIVPLGESGEHLLLLMGERDGDLHGRLAGSNDRMVPSQQQLVIRQLPC